MTTSAPGNGGPQGLETPALVRALERRRARARRHEENRPYWAVVTGVLGIFPVAIFLGVRALGDRRRALTEGRRYKGFGTASAWIGIALGSATGIALILAVAGALAGPIDDAEAEGAAPSSRSASATSASRSRTAASTSGWSTCARFDRFAGSPAPSGFALVRVEVEATNLTDRSVAGPICAPGYDGVVLVDDDNVNYRVASMTGKVPDAAAGCRRPVAAGKRTSTVLAFQVPAAAVAGMAGVAVWDPSEAGDPGGVTYYFVESRLDGSGPAAPGTDDVQGA